MDQFAHISSLIKAFYSDAYLQTQQAHNVETTSIQRWFNVDVELTLFQRCVLAVEAIGTVEYIDEQKAGFRVWHNAYGLFLAWIVILVPRSGISASHKPLRVLSWWLQLP